MLIIMFVRSFILCIMYIRLCIGSFVLHICPLDCVSGVLFCTSVP